MQDVVSCHSYSTSTMVVMSAETYLVERNTVACRILLVQVLSVTRGNPSLEEISLSDEQFWPIYPSLAEIPPVTDSTSDV